MPLVASLLLVAMPFAPSSVLVTTSKALVTSSDALAPRLSQETARSRHHCCPRGPFARVCENEDPVVIADNMLDGLVAWMALVASCS